MDYTEPITTEEWREYYTLLGHPLVFGIAVDGDHLDLRDALYLEEGDLRLDSVRALGLLRQHQAEM